MPKNRHAQIRYEVLDRCLSNRKIRWDYARLKAKVEEALDRYDPTGKGVSKSTFYEDLKWLESSDGYNMEIEKVQDGRSIYYRYANEGDSIHKSSLSDHDLQQLKEALNTLKTIKGLPNFEWLEELNVRIENGLIDKNNGIVHFEYNNFLEGIEHLSRIYNAILYKECLLVRYQSFKYPSPIEICFHPWHLRQYNQRWFAFGYNPSQPELPFMTLPLDRIKDISPHNNHYIQNNDVDFEEWFEDMIGVTRTVNSKIEKVTLQFSSERAPYVLTKPLHGSQKKLKHDKWGLIISLEVIVNLELFQTIFSFGADVIVLAPKSVREAVVNNISSSLEKYAT